MFDIYSILSSKSSNIHYINRYLKFINSCKVANEQLNTNDFMELHHICPKASDLFPEYINLIQYPENGVNLTFRQHLIAHVMLWKIFGKSQATALNCMLHTASDDSSPTRIRKIPAATFLRYVEKLANDAHGFAAYKDSNNKKYFLHKDDPLITELGLVGNNKGYFHSEEAKQAMSAAKRPNKTVKLYFLDCKISVKLFSSKYHEYIAQGWNPARTSDDLAYIKAKANVKNSVALLGTANYMYPDTKEFAGRLSKDDPKIVELGLVPLATDGQKRQWKDRSAKAVEALTGTNIYNNGKEEARFREDPGGDWVLGRLPRSDNYKQNFLNGIRAKNASTVYWNNGVICKKFPNDQHPGEEWAKGMLPRSK